MQFKEMTKTRKTKDISKKGKRRFLDETYQIDGRNCQEVTENECSIVNLNNFELSHDDTEDADETVNDGHTSTSFSLQECMDEFRARRIRRNSLSHRQEPARGDAKTSKNGDETTELELINQNLCNKEQERKFKPCQNGFCYCFTSDSGDGGNFGGCQTSTRGIQARLFRRNRRSECSQSSLSKRKSKEKGRDYTSQVFKSPERNKNDSSTKCCSTAVRNQLTAISSIETSAKDAPLLHIIQELRENCVISKVKVNKHKVQPIHNSNNSKKKITQKIITKNTQLDKNISSKPKIVQTNRMSHKYTVEEYTPTAPTLETLSEINFPEDADQIKSSPLETVKKCSKYYERRGNIGGQLLKKRLLNSQFTYNRSNTNRPPQKPPRISLSNGDKYSGSSVSTSSSLREAEQVVDDFLNERGFKETVGAASINNAKSVKRTEKMKQVVGGKSKSFQLTSEDIKNKKEKLFLTYTSLSDISKIVKSKKSRGYGKNIMPVGENANRNKTTTSIVCSDPKINDMLNYDADIGQKIFHSSATQAQPQHRSSCDVIGNENPIGWQIPPRLNLDTVDGILCHNLASNLEDKNTPVKTKLISSSKKSKTTPGTQKFYWSEQLRQLSPWSNKYKKINGENDNKSYMRFTSKAFIKSSKKKILRLVSPKKENMERKGIKIRKTPYRNIGVQTSCDEVSCRGELCVRSSYEQGSTLQSPPGSYHSPIQSSHIQSPSSTQSQNSTSKGNKLEATNFDFSRTVHSPPKKAHRSSQRKLNFPLNCALVSTHDEIKTKPECNKKTYRSFNSELNQDVSISKINYILSNIRAKLEASDEQAVRTFQETECVVDLRSPGFDCPDGHYSKLLRESDDVCDHIQYSKNQDSHSIDPIYSEIEDYSVHMSKSQNFENHTSVVSGNPEVMYAKVNKCHKRALDESKLQLMKQIPQMPLSKIIHDSLKNKKVITNIIPLPPLQEPPGSESVLYSSPTSLDISPLSHCQSLNNVRIMEHNSSPKKQQNLSKSDLSLHRSEIFLENLCKSELVVDAGDVRGNLEKVQNNNKETQICSYVPMKHPSSYDDFGSFYDSDQNLNHNDTGSYELPNDNCDYVDNVNNVAEFNGGDDFSSSGSNLGLSTIIPLSSYNQSTPKKQQSFTTKDMSDVSELKEEIEPINTGGTFFSSCPNTPYKPDNKVLKQQQPSHSLSVNDITEYDTVSKSNVKMINTLVGYKGLKNILQKSFRKSKKFLKSEKKRLSTSFKFSTINNAGQTLADVKNQSYFDSNLNIEALFLLSETVSISQQIAQTVSICRKLPDLEVSMEMVEAERLLLFSSLRRENKVCSTSIASRSQNMDQKPKMRFFIDEMFLPVVSNVNHDIFFNYFYIVTFECGGVIRSTQSAECVNGTAIFEDCGLEFMLFSDLDTPTENSCKQNAIKCNIFMLRLRKISTISFGPEKSAKVKNPIERTSSSLMSTSSSSSSFNEVVSRFNLHASFALNASDFVPYEYVDQESSNSDRICIRASCFCTVPLTHQRKLTNLSGQIRLKGRSEVRFPKRVFVGFLNVEDPYLQHNWNRRWCTLDGIFLYVWKDENILNLSPLIALDLRDAKRNMKFPLTSSPRELCARPRSFGLECSIRQESKDASSATIFFATETQENLEDWLKNLNIVLDFIFTWL